MEVKFKNIVWWKGGVGLMVKANCDKVQWKQILQINKDLHIQSGRQMKTPALDR